MTATDQTRRMELKKLNALEGVDFNREFQIGILKNIERLMPKETRRHKPNWVIVMDYLLAHTSRGGSTSAYEHCGYLGIDPDGKTFYNQ